MFSPLYRIEVENLQRPQYSEYLNVPQGLMMTQNEYENRPHTDMLGVNRVEHLASMACINASHFLEIVLRVIILLAIRHGEPPRMDGKSVIEFRGQSSLA